MPAARVSVAKPTPRSRQACSVRQSSAKPADGASNATGLAAIVVHTSHKASGCGTCAYWIGRPCRASPASRCARLPMKRSSTRRGWLASTLHDGVQRPEPEPVARRQGRRRRAVFRARAMIARAEDDGGEAGGVADRQPAGEPDLDRLATRQMRAAEAGRQGCRVVGNDQVTGVRTRFPTRCAGDGGCARPPSR